MNGTGCASYQQTVLSRRGFLGASIGGWSLPAILAARGRAASAGRPPPDTAVIQYWLGGAASHFETYDPKPDAPSEFRGPFRPIATNVPGRKELARGNRRFARIGTVNAIRNAPRATTKLVATGPS